MMELSVKQLATSDYVSLSQDTIAEDAIKP